MNITSIKPESPRLPSCSGVDCGRRAACSRYVGSQTEHADLASCTGSLLFTPRHQRVSTACTFCQHGRAAGVEILCMNPALPMQTRGDSVVAIRAIGGECGPRAQLMESRS